MARGQLRRRRAAVDRGRDDHRPRRQGGSGRAARRDRRGVPSRLVAPRLPGRPRRDRHRPARTPQGLLGRGREPADPDHRRRGPPRAPDLHRRLHLPRRRRDHRDPEDHDPGAGHGEPDGWSEGDRPRRLSGPRALLGRPRRRLSRRGGRPVRRRVPLPPDGRRRIRLPVRRRLPCPDGRARRGSRRIGDPLPRCHERLHRRPARAT